VISGLVQILLFQGVGELVSNFLLPLIPGPVIGLVLLLAYLAARRRVPEDVDRVGSALVQHLGLLWACTASPARCLSRSSFARRPSRNVLYCYITSRP
jgi:hypothetical protein